MRQEGFFFFFKKTYSIKNFIHTNSRFMCQPSNIYECSNHQNCPEWDETKPQKKNIEITWKALFNVWVLVGSIFKARFYLTTTIFVIDNCTNLTCQKHKPQMGMKKNVNVIIFFLKKIEFAHGMCNDLST